MKFKLLTWIFAIVLLCSFTSASEQLYPIGCNDNGHKEIGQLCTMLFDNSTAPASYYSGLNGGAVVSNVTLNFDVTKNLVYYQIMSDDWAIGSTVEIYDWQILRSTDNITFNVCNLQYNQADPVGAYYKNYTLVGDCEGNYFKLSINRSGTYAPRIREMTFNFTSISLDYINLSVPQPNNLNFTTSNTINFNATMNNSFTTNVSLYINGTLNQTVQYAGGVNTAISFNNTMPDGSYSYFLRAIQGNDSNYNETTATYPFYVDNAVPTLSTNFSNGTIVRDGTNISFQFNLSDNLMLWGYNLTLNGVVVNSKTNLGVSTYQFNWSRGNWLFGRNNLSIWFADAHTAESIEPYTITKTIDSIKFDSLEIKTLTPIDNIAYVKSKDRYSFVFETKELTDTIQIKVPDGCVYQNREDLYSGWFVCPGLKWMDFANDGGYTFSLDKDIITITSKKAIDLFMFNSVGSLNTATADFYVTGYPSIDNCSTYTLRSFNFTFYNTTGAINTLINATMNGHISSGIYGEFNISWPSNSNDGICITPNNSIIPSNIQLQYIVPGCGTRNYYLDTTLTNVTQNINLYCDAATSQITFSVKDQNDEDVPDVFIYIQKYDVGTATATTVEIIKTDTNGQAVGNIIKFTQAYKFILVYGGVVVKEESPQYIMLDTKTFRLNLGADTYFTNFDIIQGITCGDVTYTNATTSFSYTWVDSTNNMTQACLDIYLTSNTQHILVNTTCNTSVAGTITLSIPPPFGSNSYIGVGTVYVGSDKFVCGNSGVASFNLGWKDYGTESLFLSFLVIVFLITVGLWNPVVAIALMMVAIVLLNILGLFHLSWTWLIGFILLGGVVMFKMRQN